MALRRNQTYHVGDVVRFRVPRGCRVMVTAPDSMHLEIPAPTGAVNLWVPQVGEWLVEWPKGREVLVVERADVISTNVEITTSREAVTEAVARSVKPRQYTGGA